ncbi:MAG: helix-turn-helix transcriptional regulator [Acutalibacteraceae bacterium]
MAYSELIKNFEKIRDYMREFYVYGFKSRDEYDKKSARSYDNERRRIESWLGNYIGFRQTENGKNVFLSIDSRSSSRNPLYNVLKSKSFTDGDITLHFILFDILHSSDIELTLSEIAERIDDYLLCFENPMEFDESTVRKKLKEYSGIGLIKCRKDGKRALYSRCEDSDISSCTHAVEFFAEAGLCGVIGSYILDKAENKNEIFSFKHHYITHALESEVLCSLFDAIREKKRVTLTNCSRRNNGERTEKVIPIKIFVSVQSGRRYLAGFSERFNSIKMFRLDYISNIVSGEVCEIFDCLREEFSQLEKHMWGVGYSAKSELEHVEFTVYIGAKEEHIYKRLMREKRCGNVERIDKNTAKFTADVYDSNEMLPWIRTFICRIKALDISNKLVENRFRMDMTDLYRMYGIGGEAQ